MRKFVGVFRCVVVAMAVWGIGLQMVKYSSLLDPFVKFTNQSNLFVAICFLFAAWGSFRNRPAVSPLLKGAVTVYIMITALVYNFILAEHRPHTPPPPTAQMADGQRPGDMPPGLEPGQAAAQGQDAATPPPMPRRKPYSFSSKLLHIVVPLMAVADWLLFDPHRRYRWKYAGMWIGYPIAYLIFALVRGAMFPGSKYPYPFVDVSRIGYDGVALSGAIYGAAFVLLGLVIVAIDRMLPGAAADRVPLQPRPQAEAAGGE